MDNPAAAHLMEMVRKINEIGQRARSGAPGVDDYLRVLSADPATQWFTDLLREKSAEVERERERADRLSAALHTWRLAKQAALAEADLQLLHTLRILGIIEP